MQNHFITLEMPESMTLDDEALLASYMQKQQEFHPDVLVNKSDAEQLIAANRVADINAAYNALKKPLTRAEHLLELRGVIVNRDGNDAVKADADILTQQLEDSEYLEEIETVEALDEFKDEVQTRYDDMIVVVNEQAANEEWQLMAQNTIALKYLDKLLARIKRKKKEL